MIVNLVKFSTGEIVMASTRYDGDYVVLVNPATPMATQNGMSLMPYPMLTDTKKEIKVAREHVLFIVPISGDESTIINGYNQHFGDGTEIVLPPTKKLLTV